MSIAKGSLANVVGWTHRWTIPLGFAYVDFEKWHLHSCNYFQFSHFKGGLISEGILTLVPLPKKGAKSCPWAENLVSCLL